MDKRKMFVGLSALGVSLAGAISGIFLVAPHEGFRSGAYIDPVGIVTICYGHTGPDVKLGQKKTEDQCLDSMAEDLKEAEEGVNKVIKVPLNTYQKAALISFTYNVGEGNLRTSTLAKQFNARQYSAGCDSLLGWVYANKKKLPGLEVRRQQERKMCLGQIGVNDVINQ